MKAIFLIFYVTCCFSFTSTFSGLSGLSDGSSKTKNQNVWILTSLYRELEKCKLLLPFSIICEITFIYSRSRRFKWSESIEERNRRCFAINFSRVKYEIEGSSIKSQTIHSDVIKHCRNNLTILLMTGRRKSCVQDEWGLQFDQKSINYINTVCYTWVHLLYMLRTFLTIYQFN